MSKNLRKGKIPVTLWATKEELSGLMEVIGNENWLRHIGIFVQKLHKRGDVEIHMEKR